MKVTHVLKKEAVEKEVFDNVGFLLSNKFGGYLSMSMKENFSRYQGAFAFRTDWQLYKVIENMRLLGTTPTELVNWFWGVERKTDKASELFTLHNDAVLYEISHFDGEAQLDLDCREIHSYADMGRHYNISIEDGVLLVSYSRGAEKCYVAIKTNSDFKRINDWKKRHYEFDFARDSKPCDLYVFEALKFRVKTRARIAIGFSNRKEEAIEKVKVLFAKHDKVKHAKKEYYEHIAAPNHKISNPLVRFAYSCARKQMDDLLVNIDDKEGMFAGLPWFFQFWTRDESIALKGLMLLGRYNEVKDILVRMLDRINDDGRIPNRYPDSDLSSADGVGWAFRRLSEFLFLLKKKGLLHEYFTSDEMEEIMDKLEHSIVQLIRNHTEDGLAVNSAKETWMDTEWGGDVRDGARIEIQALRLSMYKLMKDLLSDTNNSKDKKMFETLEHEFHRRVKANFWDGNSLHDGVKRDIDATIRPNLFLAHYIYPSLLTHAEWSTCFENSIDKLWCEWGGLSTIDKSNPLFTPRYTGENNKSYHRGDSWFFVNNLAAVSMARIDRKKFHSFIDSILKASTEDILFKGFIGHAGELSSAERLESEGCLSQLWSAATYIELVHELYGL